MMSDVDLSPAVEAKLVTMFPEVTADAARQILNPEEDDRVLEAVLTLSLGDLERLRNFSDVAAIDVRDVLAWAKSSGQDAGPASYDELRKRLNLPPET
jgi:hypothetical protein